MAASFTIGGHAFKAGSSVSAYPRSARKTDGSVSGAATATATADSSQVVFAGLGFSTKYVAVGVDEANAPRAVEFATGSDPSLEFATIAYVDGIAVSGLPDGWVSVKDFPYNALGNGVADDYAGIQAMVNDVKSAITTVHVGYFPHGTYMSSGTINADQNGKAFALMGPEGGAQFQSSGATIVYTGANNTVGTGGLITFNSSNGWRCRNLGFDYNNASGSFTGHLVQVDGGVHFSDSQDWNMAFCTSRARATNTAASIIRLNKTVIAQITNCHLTGADRSVRFGDDGGSYVVSVVLRESTFNFSRTSHVHFGSADGEMLAVRDCTFEAGVNTPSITGASNCRLYKPLIDGCWSGDASGAVNWIDGLICQSNSYVGTISNNFFYDPIGGTHLKLGGGDWWVHGNAANGGAAVFDVTANASNTHITSMANSWIGTTTLWKSGTVAGSYSSLGSNNGLNAPDVLPVIPRLFTTFSGFSPNMLGLGDAGRVCLFQRGGGGVEVGLPANATTAIPIGSEMICCNEGSSSVGTITVVPAAGVTYYGPATVPARGSGMLRLIKTDTNTWFGQ